MEVLGLGREELWERLDAQPAPRRTNNFGKHIRLKMLGASRGFNIFNSARSTDIEDIEYVEGQPVFQPGLVSNISNSTRIQTNVFHSVVTVTKASLDVIEDVGDIADIGVQTQYR